jgi:hypothetical protein
MQRSVAVTATVLSEPSVETPAGRPTWTDRFARLVVAIPDRLLLMFLWSALVVSVSLLFDAFYPLLVIPAIVVVVAATWRVRLTRYDASGRSVLGSVLALEIPVGWFLANRHYRGELVSVARDPSVYTLRALWLVHHHSPNIPMNLGKLQISSVGSLQEGPLLSSATVSVPGFPYSHGSVHPQGNSLVPGLLAVAGWIRGDYMVLQANLLIGGLALLAVYAFSRRLVGPLWALAPMIALAISMPMVYFSRNPYTEPMALLVTFVGLTLLWSGWRARSTPQFFTAGLAMGAAQMARIDGAVAVLGACLGIGIGMIFTTSPELRRRGRRFLIAFAGGALVTIGIGTVDLLRNSPDYIAHQHGLIGALLLGVVVAVLVLLLLSWPPIFSSAARWLAGHGIGVARFAAIAVGVLAVVMISRPLWWMGHFQHEAPIGAMLQTYQQQAGVALDGTRSYDEQTIRWLSWYLGWPTIILAAAGLSWMAYRVVRLRDPRLLVFLTTFGVVAGLYLNDVNITPIQIWAMRRLLPVVLPCVLVAAVWLAVMVVRQRPALLWLSGALVVGIALLPVLSWNKLVTVGEETGEYNEVKSICNAIHGDRVVVLGAFPASGDYLPSTRIICGAQSLYVGNVTAAGLRLVQQKWGPGPITVVAFDATAVPWSVPPTTPLHTGQYPSWQSPLFSRPGDADYEQRSVWIGDIAGNGTVVPRSS